MQQTMLEPHPSAMPLMCRLFLIEKSAMSNEQYSKEYSISQFNSVNEEIDDFFIREALQHRKTGCLFLLYKNELACSKGKKLHICLTNLEFKKKASIYGDDIEIWCIEKTVMLIHVPLCVGGSGSISIMAHITIEEAPKEVYCY